MLWKGFQRPKRLDVDREGQTGRFGRFTAQPFERGWGTTIGNAMRRVLLSSIEGAAITAVKIEGVQHEFSPVEGVVEDATDIILNLKQVPFKLHGDEVKMLYVRIDKPGPVHARDIEVDQSVEVLDPDAHIATVSEGGKLYMELRLKNGRGYVSADRNFDEDLGIGWIPVDSVHSPVRKVNYLVESARVGQNTDYDKLTLEVSTSGASRRPRPSNWPRSCSVTTSSSSVATTTTTSWSARAAMPPPRRSPRRATSTSTRASKSSSCRSVRTTV